MRPTLKRTALLLGTLLLAGCLSAPGGVQTFTASQSTAPVGSVTVAQSDDAQATGSIEGRVFDEELRPLEGATVALSQKGVSVTTGADGSFAFTRVPVGSYVLEAFAQGHESSAKPIKVEGQVPTSAQFVLATLPVAGPYVSLTIRNGHMSCNVAAVYFHLSNSCGGGQGAENATRHTILIEPDWRFHLHETVWKSQDELYQEMAGLSPNTGWLNRTLGPHPMRLTLAPGVSGVGLHGERFPAPTNGSFDLQTTTAYAGLAARTVNDNCAERIATNSHCSWIGVGFAADIAFVTYSSTFVHAAPRDAAAYSAIPGS
jgi:hypothetical protein